MAINNLTSLAFAVLLFGCVEQSGAQGAKEAFEITKRDILWVYDGDTAYLNCRPSHRCREGRLGVRILNIDTPELRGKCPYEIKLAKMAKEETERMIYSAREIRVIPNARRPYDRYDRLLADIEVDGVNLGDHLVDEGLARVWQGRRDNWCR